MVASMLERQQVEIVEAVTAQLVQRRSRIFRRVGQEVCKTWIAQLLTALVEDLRVGSHESVRTVMQNLIGGLGGETLTFADLRFMLVTLREVVHHTCVAEPEAARAIDDGLFELALVTAMRFMAWRETTLHRRSMDGELARLESQLAELQAALADKARLVDEVQQLNAELRRQVARHSDRLMDALVARNEQLRARAMPTLGAELAGCYRVVRKIGEGGMGTVYEVVRKTDGIHLAAKLVNHGSDLKRMRRFIREAQILAQVMHHNLVAIHDVDFDDDGMLYIVMELASGSLRECEAHIGDVPWCMSVFAQVCEALASLHARTIVHRDLKPENILLIHDGRDASGQPLVKLADFGIAIALEDSSERLPSNDDEIDEHRDTAVDDSRDPSRFTATGVLLGTPSYMAPELARGSRYAGPTSDMFSFGVIACECLLGAQPFPHPAVYSPPIDLGPLRASLRACPGLPEPIAATLISCLDWEPSQRPSARALADLLTDGGPTAHAS